MKKDIKKFAVLLSLLVVIGLSGLFIGLVDLNRNYENHKENIDILAGEVFRLEKVVDVNTQRLKTFDFMKFKINAFSKRYSLFSQILDAVYDKSHQYGFEPELVLGIVQVESAFNPNAVSSKGALGLMQVMLPVWQEELTIDENRIFEVEYNIDLGLQILKQYYDETRGNIRMALHLYNNGYKYNNTAYPDQVSSAVLAFKSPPKLDLTVASPGYGR